METLLESRIGKIAIIVYAVCTLAVYVYSFLCIGDTCGLAIVLPIMPWAYLLTEELQFHFPFAVYPILILLNVSLVYVLGAGAEYVYTRLKDQDSYVGRTYTRLRKTAHE